MTIGCFPTSRNGCAGGWLVLSDASKWLPAVGDRPFECSKSTTGTVAKEFEPSKWPPAILDGFSRTRIVQPKPRTRISRRRTRLINEKKAAPQRSCLSCIVMGKCGLIHYLLAVNDYETSLLSLLAVEVVNGLMLAVSLNS